MFDSVNGSFVRELKQFGDRVFAVHYHPEQGDYTIVLVVFFYDILRYLLDQTFNKYLLCLFSQGGVLHVVNGPFSSEALGFTFRLNDNTEIQRWKPRLVRSL